MINLIAVLNQFEIKNVLRIELSMVDKIIQLSLLNIDLYIIISCVFIIIMSYLSVNFNKIVSNGWSISQESLQATILSIMGSQVTGKEGQKYFPFFYTIFIFILINNLIGLVPYSFSITAQFMLVLCLSFTIVIGNTILGLSIHGLKFLSLFVPSGTPLPLLPLLISIEFISYFVRCISLGLRLGANIFSGHLLLYILSSFTFKLLSSGFVYFGLSLVSIAFLLSFSVMELAVSVIQSLVFVILCSAYLQDCLNLHGGDSKTSK